MMTDDQRFEAHIAPLRDALTKLIALADATRDMRGHLPAAESAAMGELAREEGYAGQEPWGDDPLRAAHNSAGLLIFAANDCARAMTKLLSSEPTPVFSHTVLARSTLELAGRAWWLLDPNIGDRLRVARGMNERIYGLSQQDRLPLAKKDAKRAKERRKALCHIGEDLGFKKVRANRYAPPALEEPRPGQTEIIRKLMATGEDRRLGEFVYGLFSAVAHGTTFGLSGSVTLDAEELPGTPGVTWGAIYTGSGEVVIVLCAVVIGWGQAIDRRDKHFGWQSPDWSRAWKEALDVASASLGIAKTGV
jgi:hypothetical protein